MLHTVLDLHHEPTRSTSSTIDRQRELGLQLSLFPAYPAPEGVKAQVDLRVADDLAGMYYIG
jgi:hypothetical protein